MSATYLNNNIKRTINKGVDADCINMKNYLPENYNQKAFDNYYDNKNILSEKTKKLDFQILLYTIKSEELIKNI